MEKIELPELYFAHQREVFDNNGMNGLLRTLERRTRQPGANLYIIASPTGEVLAGNVASMAKV